MLAGHRGGAAVVPRIRIAPLATSVTGRHPAVLAKIAAAAGHGGGGQRTLRIAARCAGQWNSRTTPEVLAHKVPVLHGHSRQAGRDPGEIHVSAQALLYLSAGNEWLRKKTAAPAAAAGDRRNPRRGNRHHRPVPARRR